MAKDYCLRVKSVISMIAGPVLYQNRAMKQIAFAPRDHLLLHTRTRPPGIRCRICNERASATSVPGEAVERVKIQTGEIDVIYRASQ